MTSLRQLSGRGSSPVRESGRLRIAFVTSHPIQYQVPVFRHLAQDDEVHFEVFFAMIPDAGTQGAEFGVPFTWDEPLLDGYDYEVLRNVSTTPSVVTYRGCDTPEVLEKLRRGGFDAVVVNGWVVKTCVQTLWACRKLKIPCLVRGEANLLRPRPWWKQLPQGMLVRRYAGFLYIGEANRRFYRHYGVPDSKLTAARYCIDNERFAAIAATVDRAEVRRNWRIPEEAACFLYCGKFIGKKHPLELVQAFHRTARDRGAHLLMVGDGELRGECERFAREHRLPVTFTGFLNQGKIVAAYVASDCLVLPSDHGETWGLVVNEAMACSRPAVVSDQAGCREDLIVNSETGSWFPYGDWSRLSAVMSEFAGDRERMERMGRTAAERVAAYSPGHAAAGIKEGVLKALADIPAGR